MKKLISIILISVILISTGCSMKKEKEENTLKVENKKEETVKTSQQEEQKQIEEIAEKYEGEKPTQWGEHIDGVLSKLNTNKREIALTLDACGGKNGSKYDEELIDFLDKENIPATLFINYRWIDANKDIFMTLSKNSNFQIENHGYNHNPLSVTKKSVYNIEGTDSVKGVLDEIKLNEDKIYKLTSQKTNYFRSGTAYYDDISIKIAKDLGYKIAGFSINADGGATFSKEEVINAVSKASEGDIIIGHFNQPNGYTYEGLKEALIKLRNEGYEFVKLEN